MHDRIDDVAMDMHASPQRKTQSLHRAVIAAMGKRRAAATGGAPSLLVDQDVDSSNPPSAATSRQGSPTADSEDAVDATKAPEQEETASGKEDDNLSLIHISEPTRQEAISYAVFCLKKKKK